MKEYTIYLSSTYFGFWSFSHKNWKQNFRYWLLFHTGSLLQTIKYNFIDPLLVLTDDESIVNKDLHDIDSSDFVVAYLPRKLTIGTIMEILYSAQNNKKLILIDKSKLHRKHPWIKHWCKTIVNDEHEAALRVFRTAYLKEYKKSIQE